MTPKMAIPQEAQHYIDLLVVCGLWFVVGSAVHSQGPSNDLNNFSYGAIAPNAESALSSQHNPQKPRIT